ncbi:guanylate-binding protein 1-like [Muntiacus reevesi]|uniref:guanylate-binding protein 1-like n=1 Tax=Muntiacus reevesi TaxID=9886 RepID=UPI00330754C8
MASEIHMPAPECLIENINGRLVVNPVTAKILSAIRQPVVVVAIVGLYRTGKSYLMNKLAGKNKGFSLGSTVQSHTKGIWMWCMPHPEKPDHALVLLDTEGLGDVEKGDNQNDSWIFALEVLLSSTFVYNSIGTINQQAMDQLHYVTELTRRIRAKSSPDKHEVQDSANFVSFFPDFVWTLRDFSLELEADGQPITADEYLEKSLKLKQGNDKKTKTFNEPRLCIRKFFPEKKCFIFDRPAHRKHLIHLEQLQEEDLNPEFREQVADFCCYILSHSKAKTLSGGITVNGPRLQSLVQTYVNAISSGDLPCMENAVLTLAETENLAAVQKAIAHYDQQMGQKLKLLTETLQELLDLHRASEKEAIEVFMKNSFKDVNQVFQKKLADELEAKRHDFCRQNMKASSDYCMALIDDIFHPLYEDVKQGTFSKPGGYYLFIKKMNEPKDKYHQVPRKGVQTEETLRKYLGSKEGVADALRQTDQSLTEKEEETEVERIKSEAVEAAKKMLEEMQKKYQQMMQEKEASYQEHMKQLTEKREKERAQLIADQERVLALKLQEQGRLLQEEFQKESMKLHEEIVALQKNQGESQSSRHPEVCSQVVLGSISMNQASGGDGTPVESSLESEQCRRGKHTPVSGGIPTVAGTLRALPTQASDTCLQRPSLPAAGLN